MDLIRWLFFLTLALLMIASCNTARAEFRALPASAPMHQPADAIPA
jgi:hypothetical protein